MEPGDGDSRKKRKGTAAPPARKRRKAPPPLAPPPSVPGGAPTARRRGKPAGAAAAAPPSLVLMPALRMARAARRRRKPTGAAAPPSLAPPPSARMAHGDGVAPPARKRRKGSSLQGGGKRGRRTDSGGSSGRNGSDGGRGRGRGGTEERDDGSSDRNGSDGGTESSEERDGGSSGRNSSDGGTESSEEGDDGTESLAGGEDSQQGLAGRADDPNPNASGAGGAGHTALGHPDAPIAPHRMAHGDGGGVAPPALPGGGKRGRRTDSGGSSGGNGSAGGHGGAESSDDDDTKSLASGEDIRQGLAGLRGDDPNPNGSGAGSAGHAALGHPDAPIAPPENVAAARGKISVAHTPNIPPRFEGLLRNITFLIPYESEGRSYECSLSRMNTFLKWSRSEMALFFEWSDDKMEMKCWMHNIKKGEHIKFTVNAAFSHEMDNIKVERAAVAFSTNFSDDEYWSGLKDMLSNMFGSFEGNGLKEYDYLYVFTRVGDSVYFRNFKIISLPKANDSQLVLREINTAFCLKLVNDQGTPKSSDIGPHLTKHKTHTNLILCLVAQYRISNGQTGNCLSYYDADFSGTAYSFLLENGCYILSLEKLDGFNTSLAEIVLKEPLLKVKPIIGSATNKTSCFLRERSKAILRSLFTEFATLLESRKCISKTGHLFMHNILVRGTEVRLHGVDLTDYTDDSDDSAKHTVAHLVDMVRRCFPVDTIPLDLQDLLRHLEKYPLDEIKVAKGDCSVMKAEDRWMLLIKLNSEYMTNVEKQRPSSDADHINEITFFEDCPHAQDWKEIMKDNEYMIQVCNLESSDQDNESDEDKNASVMNRVRRKERMAKNTSSIQKFSKKKKIEQNICRLQFSSKRNFHMHMPEKAKKDGIFPFRLGVADYILTAYFPGYLRFVQKRMREVKAQRVKEQRVKAQRGGNQEEDTS